MNQDFCLNQDYWEHGRILSWFSCGAASAVALKKTIEKFGDMVLPMHCNTLSSEHPDNLRFLLDVEKWIGQKVITIASEKYKDVDDVIEKTRYMAGIDGARCTTELKKNVRRKFQLEGDLHILGYTADKKEVTRALDFRLNNFEIFSYFPLIDLNIDKQGCFDIIKDVGIKLPEIYKILNNANCIGCVKATSPKYWNLIRKHYPDTFDKRCRQSRNLNVKLVRVKGVRVFLDTLDFDNFDETPDDDFECGVLCSGQYQR